MFHTVFDMKGYLIWYNQSLADYSKIPIYKNFGVNIVEKLIDMNKAHPFGDFLLNILEERPKEAKCKKYSLI